MYSDPFVSGITPDEIPGCHCVALSHPKELAEILVGYIAG
jgi:hypothetical protein